MYMYINTHVTCMCIMSFLAIPGLIFAVNQDVIEYNDLTESALRDFFSILEDNSPLLNLNGAANITGVYTTCTCTYHTYCLAQNYEAHNGCGLAVTKICRNCNH